MKRTNISETNEQIKERLNIHSLDGDNQDAVYRLKISLGFEPLDDFDYILRTLDKKQEISQGEEQ